MSDPSPPEVSVGQGWSHIKLTGKDAIRAAGWTLRLLLIARATRMLVVSACTAFAAVMWWLS